MAYTDIKPGKYPAKAVSGYKGVSKNKGTPFIEVTFEFENEPGEKETIKWTGYLTEKTTERTYEALAIAGWNGEFDSNNSIPVNYFDKSANPMITIVEEDYTDRDGNPKTSMKVAWVNQPGTSRYEAEPDVVKSAFAGMDFKAKLAAARSKLNIEVPKKKAIKNHAPGAINQDEELPF